MGDARCIGVASRCGRGLVRIGGPVTVVLECRTVNAMAAEKDGGAPTDADLLAASAAGDRQAFAQLYARHAPWLLLRLGRRCPDRGLVDEVLQDTFVAVWRGAAKWDGRGPVAAWMWGISVRRLVDATRRRPAPTVPLDGLPEGTGGSAESAEDRALSGVEHGAVGAA